MADQIVTVPAGPDMIVDMTGDPRAVSTSSPDMVLTYQGPPGRNGTDAGRVIVHQSTPSASWVIQHDLGAYPQVEILDDQLEQIDTDVIFGDASHVTIVFAHPTTGYAVLT